MQWPRLVFFVIAVGGLSIDNHDPNAGKPGWELSELSPAAVAVATKVRLRGLYPAGSVLKDPKALGGFGPCDNFPFKLGDKDWGAKGKVALIAFPEEKVAYFKHQGIALRVINRSEKVAAFAAFDSLMYILQEAQDEKGRWREIESPPDIAAFCGNSFHRVLLGPDQYWQFPARLYQGTFKTKIRFRLDPTSQPGQEPPIYSNEFEGFVDPAQFRIGPNRATLGQALRSEKATPEVIGTLIEAIGDDDPRTRRHVASHLGGLGPAAKESIPVLQAAIKGSDLSLRAEAAAALFKIDAQPKQSIDTLAALVQGQDEEARKVAVFLLGEIGAPAKDAIPALCNALAKERDERMRYSIAEILGKMKARPDLCVPALVKTLGDSKWIVRSYAAGALGEFGADARQATGELTRALKDADGHVRVSAALALWQIDGKVEPSLGVLTGCLKIDKEHDYVPDAAAQALGKIGPSAKSAVPALNQVLSDKNAWRGSRISTAGALWKITNDTKPTMAVFLRELRDPNLRYESDTCRMFEILEEMGPAAKEATPALRSLSKNETSECRDAAAKALKKIES